MLRETGDRRFDGLEVGRIARDHRLGFLFVAERLTDEADLRDDRTHAVLGVEMRDRCPHALQLVEHVLRPGIDIRQDEIGLGR